MLTTTISYQESDLVLCKLTYSYNKVKHWLMNLCEYLYAWIDDCKACTLMEAIKWPRASTSSGTLNCTLKGFFCHQRQDFDLGDFFYMIWMELYDTHTPQKAHSILVVSHNQ